MKTKPIEVYCLLPMGFAGAQPILLTQTCYRLAFDDQANHFTLSMTATIQTFLLLFAVLVVVAVVARRLNTASSILLVVAGILLALIPGLPRIALAPELVLLGILPPLIYSAGVAMSWREFRFNLRPII